MDNTTTRTLPSADLTLPVFYSREQVSHPSTYSPSPRKPALVVERWLKAGFPIRTHPVVPLDRDGLAIAHDRFYVDDVLDLRRDDGFGSRSAEVSQSLHYTTGSMLMAARAAVRNRSAAVSPTSGFHHAGYASGGGFCTFNGLMIAALTLRTEGLVRRVAILDCDEHYGNGTDDIIEALGLSAFVRHVTVGSGYRRESRAFLKALPRIVAGFVDCDLILYQAGADPHIDDPLGGWLSTEQLFERDRLVFAAAKRHALPIAWNLAGGYQRPIEKVLEIHDNTLRACLAEYLGTASVEEPDARRGDAAR